MLAQQNKYFETKVQTATPEQLLIMLCDGAIRFTKLAIEGIKQKNHNQAHQNLIKVQDIIAEFTITLDPNSAVAEPLMRLYEYFIHRLTEANMKKEAEPAEEVLKHLLELKETWIQAALSVKQQAKSTAPAASHG
jgi:flagellar protein FliS